MGVPLTRAVRERIVSLLGEGFAKTEISQLTEVPYSSLLKICKRYGEQGIEGLTPSYSQCGRKKTPDFYRFKRRSVWLKRLHMEWGAPIIRVVLTKRYPNERIPSIRQMQLWFIAAHLNKPRQKKGQPFIGHALATHNIWQVDAKERFRLTQGQDANYLNIVDEYSGAWLEAPLFPLCPCESSTYVRSERPISRYFQEMGQTQSLSCG